MKRLNDSIHPLIYVLTRARIQTKLVSNWLDGKLAISGDKSPVLMKCQALLLAQNPTPRQPFQGFWRWSWHV